MMHVRHVSDGPGRTDATQGVHVTTDRDLDRQNGVALVDR